MGKEQFARYPRYDVGREILKLIAIVTMTIDHIGAVLYPEHAVLRAIGRLAFPLFSYLLVLGVESEKDIPNYMTRLFLFGLISQVPFSLAFGYALLKLNIFFTLALGVVFLSNPILIVLPFLASVFLDFDYGLYGIILIGCMRILYVNTKLGVISLVFLGVASWFLWETQIFFLISLPFILLHKSDYLRVKRGVTGDVAYPAWRKYLFYVYYPLHLTALYLVNVSFF